MLNAWRVVFTSLVVVPGFLALPLAAQRTKIDVPLDPSQVVRRVPSAAPPTVTSIGGGPHNTSLNWLPASPTVAGVQLVRSDVLRWKQDAPDCCKASTTVPFRGPNYVPPSWFDQDFPLPGIYVYRITTVYSDGSQGMVQVDYTRPDPVNPATLKAVQTGPATVVLTWPEISNGTFYQVWGGGLLNTGLTVQNFGANAGLTVAHYAGRVELTITGVPSGPQTWMVGTFYRPNFCPNQQPGVPNPTCQSVSTAVSDFTKTSLDVANRFIGLRAPTRPPR